MPPLVLERIGVLERQVGNLGDGVIALGQREIGADRAEAERAKRQTPKSTGSLT